MDKNLTYGIIFVIIIAIIGIAVLLSSVNFSGTNDINGTNGINGLDFNSTVPYTFLFNGTNGLNGINGINGVNGLDFNSSNNIFLFNGTQGIQGIQGIQGEIGLTGSQGIQGDKGDKGDTGSQGIQGIQGIQGVKGDTGATGSSGLISVSSPLVNDSGVLELNQTLENPLISITHSQLTDWASATSSFLTSDDDSAYETITALGSWGGSSNLVTLGTVTTGSWSATNISLSKIPTMDIAHIPYGLSAGIVGLGNVENTALSTWAGTSSIVTLGTVTTGTWQGTNISLSYIPTIDNAHIPNSIPSWKVGLGNVENTALSTWTGSSNIATVGGTVNGYVLATEFGYLNQAVLTSSSPSFAGLTVTGVASPSIVIADVTSTRLPALYFIRGSTNYGSTIYTDYKIQDNGGVLRFYSDASSTELNVMSIDGAGNLNIAGTLTEKYMSGDYGVAWASISLPSGTNGMQLVAYNSNAGILASRLYVYTNGAWHYIAII